MSQQEMPCPILSTQIPIDALEKLTTTPHQKLVVFLKLQGGSNKDGHKRWRACAILANHIRKEWKDKVKRSKRRKNSHENRRELEVTGGHTTLSSFCISILHTSSDDQGEVESSPALSPPSPGCLVQVSRLCCQQVGRARQRRMIPPSYKANPPKA